MATRAYVLMEAGVGRSREVTEALRRVPEIRLLDVVTGPYDIIAVVEAENLETIGRIVTNSVHAVPGVLRTVTCLSVSSS